MRLYINLCICMLAFLTSCQDSYFNDGGKLPENMGKFDGSTMEYLERQPKLFDTLTILIKMNKLENVVNASGSTFFAPQDYSIHNYFKLKYPDPTKRPKSFEDISKADMEEIAQNIQHYIIPNQKIMKAGLSTVYSYGTSSSKRRVRFNLVREDYLGNVNMGASNLMFSLDVKPLDAVPQFQSAKVVVSDIETKNGVVQTLVTDTHVFGFK